MGTLEEVIRAIEECRDSYVAGKIIKSDALHYLKEYRVVTDICHKHGIASVWGQVLPDPEKTDWDKKLNFDNAYDNDPLDWETLKQMKGKPVWVEMDGYKPNWGIVMNQDKRNGRLLLCGYDEVCIQIEIAEEGEGAEWQAYRKEKSEIPQQKN